MSSNFFKEKYNFLLVVFVLLFLVYVSLFFDFGSSIFLSRCFDETGFCTIKNEHKTGMNLRSVAFLFLYLYLFFRVKSLNIEGKKINGKKNYIFYFLFALFALINLVAIYFRFSNVIDFQYPNSPWHYVNYPLWVSYMINSLLFFIPIVKLILLFKIFKKQ